MEKQHHYSAEITWTGNRGQGTSGYRNYSRDHLIHIDQKPDIAGSSDAAFRGDKTRHTPEDLLLSSVATCHMLWFLHLAAEAGVVVTAYRDEATATMQEDADGAGQFTAITLHPMVTVTDASMIDKANGLHARANALCFIARSVNFPIAHQPVCRSGEGA